MRFTIPVSVSACGDAALPPVPVFDDLLPGTYALSAVDGVTLTGPATLVSGSAISLTGPGPTSASSGFSLVLKAN
jgi:hypothetical protein